MGDGAAGVAGSAPFDRVHVTCGVTTVRQVWVRQTRPGGVIAFPWAPGFGDGHKVRLTVTGDGRAVGGFEGGASYMMLRSQRSTGLGGPDDGGTRESRTWLDPRTITGDSYGADVAIAGMLPDVLGAERTVGGRQALVLADASRTSWARCGYEPGASDFPVVQSGPRRLFDEVADAYLTWVGWGSPGRRRFGFTVGPEGQHLWRESPDNPIARGDRRS
ncbi:hypothetical protein [Actinomadura litoris]|uniref:hypothetical protein n=1 Tax=Actinomadura litoris TaxID=2678616 RepID=UPI001FA6AEFE|nr:hypothetical protein [Actinomadura litoris]